MNDSQGNNAANGVATRSTVVGSRPKLIDNLQVLNFSHLLYFWAVARDGSIAGACERLHLSQVSGVGLHCSVSASFTDPTERGRGMRMGKSAALSVALACWAFAGQVRAALVVNAAQPVTDRITVNVIAVADNDGSDSTAGLLGTSTRRAQVFSLVDVIFAQAGVDVAFTMRPGTYNSSFARIDTPGSNNPRPNTDLRDLYQNAAGAGGVLSTNTNTVNLFLVTIVPGFSQLDANYSAGIATLAGNGIAFFGGSTLSTYPEGREVLASVLAHEIGHNLGLEHISVSQNLMQSGGGGQLLNTSQVSVILNSRFTVPLPQPTPGDFNNDDLVDGADFLLWQRGQSPSRLSSGDLSAWESHFASTSAAYSVATYREAPEPSAVVLASLACVGLWSGRRRRSATSSDVR